MIMILIEKRLPEYEGEKGANINKRDGLILALGNYVFNMDSISIIRGLCMDGGKPKMSSKSGYFKGSLN